MVYQRIRLKSNEHIFSVYRCPNCGKVNINRSELSAQSLYSTRGALTRGAIENRRADAEAVLKKRSAKLHERVMNDSLKRRYRHSQFHYSCSSCGVKPLWCKFDYRVLNAVANIIFPIMVILGVISLDISYKDGFSSFNGVAFAFLLLLCCFLLIKITKFIHTLIYENRIKKLDEKNIPILCATEKEAEKIAMEMLEADR